MNTKGYGLCTGSQLVLVPEPRRLYGVGNRTCFGRKIHLWIFADVYVLGSRIGLPSVAIVSGTGLSGLNPLRDCTGDSSEA